MSAMGTIAWAAFWVAGLPSYYQQYSPTFMVWFDAILLVGIVAFLYRAFRRVRSSRRLTVV